VFELFPGAVPFTAENFRCLCTGEKGMPHHYKGNSFHRIIADFMMQCRNNYSDGLSINGGRFDDEKVWYPHTHPGVLSMANKGPDTNGSGIFICYGPQSSLNNKHIVFGRVIHGFDICLQSEHTHKD